MQGGDGTNTALQVSTTAVDFPIESPTGGASGMISDLATADGSSFVGFEQAGTGAVTRSAQAKMRDIVSVLDFGADPTGDTNSSIAIQKALDTGLSVYIPQGTYLIVSPLQLKTTSQTIYGDGAESILLTSTDIETIYSSTPVFGVVVKNLYFSNTVSEATTGPTHFQIHFGSSASGCTVQNCNFITALSGLVVRTTHHAGVWFEGSNLNNILDCTFTQAQILMGSTDSTIRGGFVYSFAMQYAIKITSQGDVVVDAVRGILGGPDKGCVWIPAASYMNKITNCYFGGSYSYLNIGNGVTAVQPQMLQVIGNTFHEVDGIPVYIDTATSGNVIANNTFWATDPKQNDPTNTIPGNPDIRIQSTSYQSTGIVIVGNVFNRFLGPIEDGMPGIGKSYAVVIDGAYNTLFATITGNSVTGSNRYFDPAFSLNVAASTVFGNVGLAGASRIAGGVTLGEANTDDVKVVGDLLLGTSTAPSQTGGGQIALGDNGLALQKSGYVAAGGTLDLIVNTETYFGSPGGFSGTLCVSSTRANYIPQSRREVYSAMCYGTTATFTQIGIQDGAGGGSVYTLTMTSNGVIRFTNTSGQDAEVRLAFFGVKSLA